jgi:hypothetical protein
MIKEAKAWAIEEFGDARLGDARRTARLVKMASALARRPGGRISDVFTRGREQQGAYDFLEEAHAKAGPIGDATGRATVRRAAACQRCFVMIDGSSLSVVDHADKKGFGRIGAYTGEGRGVKMINALAVGPDGHVDGLVHQEYWCRANDPSHAAARGASKKKRNRNTPTEQKETQRWLNTIAASERRFQEHASHVERVYVIDREADCHALLTALASTGQGFLVRSNWDRRIEVEREGLRDRGYLRPYLATLPRIGIREVQVPGSKKQAARAARMELRVGTVILMLRRAHGRSAPVGLRVNIVQTREVGTTPPGEKPLDWTFITNLGVQSVGAVHALLDAYALRWRIEEFHKTLKSGGCDAESMQLRSPQAVVKWAMLLSAVAARAEQLKHLARTAPQEPATNALSELELRALLLLKRQEKKRTESVPNAVPNLHTAIRWLADLGGYTGKSSGGPPGTITIGRGLQRVIDAAQVLAALQNERSDQW